VGYLLHAANSTPEREVDMILSDILNGTMNHTRDPIREARGITANFKLECQKEKQKIKIISAFKDEF
jgi:hypothetical protein